MAGIVFMRENVKVTTTNTESYESIHMEGTEKGIFLRNPLKKISFQDGFDWEDDSAQNVYTYARKIKNPVRRMYEICIGNGTIVKELNEWMNDYDFAGFTGNILCSPIYFKRKFRQLHLKSNTDSLVKEIVSKGYENEFELCSGGCEKEKTQIKFRDKKKSSFITKDSYCYTYSHICEELIKKA